MLNIYKERDINDSYERAKELYGSFGVDTDRVLEDIKKIPISIHCWQGDDVGGFEVDADGVLGGGDLSDEVITREKLEMLRNFART